MLDKLLESCLFSAQSHGTTSVMTEEALQFLGPLSLRERRADGEPVSQKADGNVWQLSHF